MIDYIELKEKFNKRLSEVATLESNKEDICQHEWKTFKQTILPSREHDNDPPFTKTSAYFIVRACTKCHSKINIDYVIED